MLKKLWYWAILPALCCASEMTKGPRFSVHQCLQFCSNCSDMTNKQYCIRDCFGLVNTTACSKAETVILSRNDVINNSDANFLVSKHNLLEANPGAQGIIESNSNAAFYPKGDRSLFSFEVEDTVRVLIGLRKELYSKLIQADNLASLPNHQQDLMELRQDITEFRRGLREIDQAIQSLRLKREWMLQDLRKAANSIYQNERNLYNFAAGWSHDRIASSTPTRSSLIKERGFCYARCNARTCKKDARLFTQCMTRCPQVKIQNCLSAAKTTSVYAEYNKWLQANSHLSNALPDPKQPSRSLDMPAMLSPSQRNEKFHPSEDRKIFGVLPRSQSLSPPLR